MFSARLASRELHDVGSPARALRADHRLRVPADERVARDHLRNHQPCSGLGGEQAESPVADAGHGREQDAVGRPDGPNGQRLSEPRNDTVFLQVTTE